MSKTIILIGVLAVIVVAILDLERLKPAATTTTAEPSATLTCPVGEEHVNGVCTSTTPLAAPSPEGKALASITPAQPKSAHSSYLTPAQKAKKYEPGHELAGISAYHNLAPGQETITLQQLVGKKVILVDFWTYSCINCQRTLPYLNAWYEKYHDQGLEIIGVHTPEFAFEKEKDNVARAISQYGVKYPVVQDNDYATWTAYANRYWPREYLIDIDGYIVEDHIGEGGYVETEKKIQELLSERVDRLKIKEDVAATISHPNVEAAPTYAVSPETYFGANRNEYLGKTLKLNGSWSIQPEYAESTGQADITYTYQAQHVYFVAHAATPVTVEILRDGQPLTVAQAGSDVVIGADGKSRVTISTARLYKFINELPGERSHVLKIIVPAAGLEAFTFTFG